MSKIEKPQFKSIKVDLIFTQKQFDVIKKGHKATSMEDKWDMAYDGKQIHLLRSWTKQEIYRAKLEPQKNGYKISELFVNQETASTDEEEIRIFKLAISYCIQWEQIEADQFDCQTDSTKSVTIMKYQAKDDKYYFIVKDKFDIADDVDRLDYMNNLRDKMLENGEMKKHLWTKETVLF